ncbi:DUF2274 domain-containing protein [Methylocystis parvus]|uniref:DUF2274 domain-containing protein n=1 Tax=Methylocystis parvus TaxID=134 RepID=A0A6B8LXY6_9HYPH|nr:DUF2274 domain-containing protein [Methylocystis parvus]QGM97287.1 DUF2274 domain-containing protein [Methylocystis parvus]WBJ98802.1 DUF2274 domain-containing protein [Methylocystis parvus OBBP]
MTKLKLSVIEDEKPVKVTVILSATLHRSLVAYAEILARESGKPVEPAKLISPMLERFMQSDRGFRRAQPKDKNLTQKFEREPQ